LTDLYTDVPTFRDIPFEIPESVRKAFAAEANSNVPISKIERRGRKDHDASLLHDSSAQTRCRFLDFEACETHAARSRSHQTHDLRVIRDESIQQLQVALNAPRRLSSGPGDQ
jgi:hypothetical protein